MRRLTAICANCRREVVISNNIVLPSRAAELLDVLPDDWRKVSIDFGNQGGKAQAEVCSFECSMGWIDMQRQAQYDNWQQQLGYQDKRSLDRSLALEQ